MKKVFVLLIFIVFFPLRVSAISASSAIVMDLNSNRVFYESNIHEKRLIASITKIMTCIVAIENSDINKVVKVDEKVLKAYGSAIYIEIGEEISIKDLLYGLMLRSGNDAALVIANNVSKNEEEFVNLMNKYAKKIGMKNTNYINPHGLEDNSGNGNISTSYDMALLTKYAMKNEIFRNIFSTKEYKIKTNYKTYNWYNKNKLLHKLDYITGGKTGYTKKAKRTLVTTAKKDNIELVIVTLNDENDFNDHQVLYESIFKKYKSFLVLNKNKFYLKKDDYYNNDRLFIKDNYYLALAKNEREISIDFELVKLKKYKTNDLVGKAKIYIKDKLVYEQDIFVEKISKKISLLERIKRWFNG